MNASRCGDAYLHTISVNWHPWRVCGQYTDSSPSLRTDFALTVPCGVLLLAWDMGARAPRTSPRPSPTSAAQSAAARQILFLCRPRIQTPLGFRVFEGSDMSAAALCGGLTWARKYGHAIPRISPWNNLSSMYATRCISVPPTRPRCGGDAFRKRAMCSSEQEAAGLRAFGLTPDPFSSPSLSLYSNFPSQEHAGVSTVSCNGAAGAEATATRARPPLSGDARLSPSTVEPQPGMLSAKPTPSV